MTYSLVVNGELVRNVSDQITINGVTYGSLSMMNINDRHALGLYDFIPVQQTPAPFGYIKGGTEYIVDNNNFTVTESYLGDIAMDADSLARATYQKGLADIKALEDSITNRMWREDAIGSVETFPQDHPSWPGMTATQAINKVNSDIIAIKATLPPNPL